MTLLSWRMVNMKKITALVSLFFLTGMTLSGLFMYKGLSEHELTTRPSYPKNKTIAPNIRLLEEKALLEEARSDNSQRQYLVRHFCENYNLGKYKNNEKNTSLYKYPPTPQYSVFYYNLYDNLSLCPIFKAGSSTWLHNFCLLAGETEETLEAKRIQLSNIARKLYPELDYDQAKMVLQTSKKLMVVRHPFERLLSAYRDKLENVNTGWEHGTGHFYRKYGAKIVKKYRLGGNKSLAQLKEGTFYWDENKPKPSGIEPTFKEFVRYLIDTDLLNYADDHWIPYNLFCTPCFLDFDYINKVETLERDQLLVIKDLKLNDRIHPGWKHRISPSNVTNDFISKTYFSQLNREEVGLLYEKYKLDFKMFGYAPGKYFGFASRSEDEA